MAAQEQWSTFKILEIAFGNNVMNKTAVFKWYNRFEQGHSSIIDEPQPGRPTSISTQHVDIVKELLDIDRRITICEITDRTEYSYGTVFNIIHNELGMRRICARWIQHMLDDNQMRQRAELSQ